MQSFVECVHTDTQPVESWDEIKNPWKLRELDSGHGEEVPKPRRRGNLYNEKVIATLTMEHFHYEVYFLTTAVYVLIYIL